ncbi:MAG TPA: Mur ligase family protein [Gaiellaceae bacterium]|jgi:dihydrofolate synthase/folylpolyglutamate synthase
MSDDVREGQVGWLEGLSPWPEEFGLGRMQRLLTDLGQPQRRYGAIHVVGTNGKTSTTLMAAALLRAEGLHTGAYISPHVRGWAERIQLDGANADLDAALGRVRPHAAGATQFEVLTAAALAEFAASGVDAAVVEAGLGGRHDATNVVDARVVILTNVSLEHTEVLGDTREAIAAEKLAVVSPGAHVVLGEPEWEGAARAAGAAAVEVAGGSNLALAVAGVEAYLGRPVAPAAAERLRVPGRLERRGEHPLEIWDGAHNLAGIGYLLPRLPARTYTIVCSILADKDPDAMLRALTPLGSTLIATQSPSSRALPAEEIAGFARPHFRSVETVPEPAAALARAREVAGPDGAVLVTGSLYLLAALSLHA